MSTPSRTATHRPAVRRRRFRHDDLVAVDLFAGFGGLTRGIEIAGFTTIMAANHNEYKVDVHEANHPNAAHWIADLVDKESSDYHSARDLPAADLLCAGVSCTNHTSANTRKAYKQGLSLFDLDDPDYDRRVTESERDRATANCVLHYAAEHHPRLILVECTTELVSWGPALAGRPKVGDGSTYRWWLRQFGNLGYRHQVLYLNAQFFGVPQSRDRYYAVFWDKNLPTPDLEHRPRTYCQSCDDHIDAVWSWRTGVPATGTVRYGTQYNYRCPRCRREVIPPSAQSITALDLTNFGTRIGDRPTPLKPATMARIERCRARFAEFPAVVLPAKGARGSERHPWQPLMTQTSQQEAALMSTGSMFAPRRRHGDTTHPVDTGTGTHDEAVLLAINNYQGAPRRALDPLPTQGGSETLSVVSTGVIPYRRHTIPATHYEPMPTVTSDQYPGLLTDMRPATATDVPATLAQIPTEDCYFRMLGPHEVGRGCGFDVDFPNHRGDFIVWGSARNQINGFGNAVVPQVGAWIGERLRRILD